VDNFKAQTTDEFLSYIGRFATTWDFLNGMLPEKSKVQTGVSYIKDQQELGLDGRFEQHGPLG